MSALLAHNEMPIIITEHAGRSASESAALVRSPNRLLDVALSP